MTRPRRSIVTVSLLGALLVGTAYVVANVGRWSFEQKLPLGMSPEVVKREVGPPATALAKGMELPGWGNHAARVVEDETWVYHAFPASVHRIVLTFRGGKLAATDSQRN
jgi:hypothetical protein